MKALQNRGRGKLKSKLAAVLIAASLLLLLLGTIGCSHSKPSIVGEPSLVGQWQKAPGQTVGMINTDGSFTMDYYNSHLTMFTYGLEFFPNGIVDIKGIGAQNYSFPDSSHIMISVYIFKFSMSGDEFTLTADNGLKLVFQRS